MPPCEKLARGIADDVGVMVNAGELDRPSEDPESQMSSWTVAVNALRAHRRQRLGEAGPAFSVGIATVTPGLMLDYPALAMQRSIEAAAPERAGLRRLAPPRSLAALLAIVISIGLAWSLVIPPWQVPDELAHFAYAQGLAETFILPGQPGHRSASSDESYADASVGASRRAYWPQTAPPDWSRTDYNAYLAVERGANRPPRTMDPDRQLHG